MTFEDDDGPVKLAEGTYDDVIVGTGLAASVLAAALAGDGRAVLHCDANGYYGDETATVPWRQLIQRLEKDPRYGAVSVDVPDDDDGSVDGNAYLFDLMPLVLYSRSDIVDALVRSRSSNYLSFRCIERHFALVDGRVVSVPMSRNDVFQSDCIDRADKRRLMKLMHVVMDGDRLATAPSNAMDRDLLGQYSDRPFREYLAAIGLSPMLQTFIIYSFCFDDGETMSTDQGIAALKKFLMSMGRFDRGALLYPVYGTGDLPQAFCRLAAVYGATYLLRCAPDLTDDEMVLGGTDQRIDFQNVITREVYDASSTDSVSRCICVSRVPIVDGVGICMLTVPPDDPGQHVVRVLQVDEASGCAPPGSYIIYLSTRQCDRAQERIRGVLERIVTSANRKRTVFFCEHRSSLIIQQSRKTCGTNQGDDVTAELKSRRRISISGSSYLFDADDMVKEARNAFEQLRPGSEFLRQRPGEDDDLDVDTRNNPEFCRIVTDDTNAG
ncbi:Rab GDP dissociation inhibitor [Plasmodiophora brassicae]